MLSMKSIAMINIVATIVLFINVTNTIVSIDLNHSFIDSDINLIFNL